MTIQDDRDKIYSKFNPFFISHLSLSSSMKNSHMTHKSSSSIIANSIQHELSVKKEPLFSITNYKDRGQNNQLKNLEQIIYKDLKNKFYNVNRPTFRYNKFDKDTSLKYFFSTSPTKRTLISSRSSNKMKRKDNTFKRMIRELNRKKLNVVENEFDNFIKEMSKNKIKKNRNKSIKW